MAGTIHLRSATGHIDAVLSARAGQAHGDTNAFDHITELGLSAESRITNITVVHENAIVGIIVDYKTPEGKKSSKKVGNFAGAKHKVSIKLAADEYVEHVSGRAGAFLDRLTLRTNKGQTLDVGGDGGSPFDLNVPHGHAVVGFQGGIGGHLHNVAVVFRPVYLWTAPVKTAHAGMTHGDTRGWDHLPQLLGTGHIASFRIAEVHATWGACDWMSVGVLYGRTGSCPKTCSDGSTPKKFKATAVHSYRTPTDIQTAILEGGPIETAFTVYQDFMSYTGGVYVHTTGSVLGGHAVKIVGWGNESGTNYWIVANSWGTGWGENGYFRIAWDQCGISSAGIAGNAV